MSQGQEPGGNRRKAPPLVLNASIASATGEKLSDNSICIDSDRRQIGRLLRWQRQSIARVLLPDAPVAKCYRVRVKPFVEVKYSKRVKRAHYGGLMTCASVWDCPICSAKITERRRVEIESADARGLSCFMVTLTLQHSRKEKLRVVRDHLAEAFRALKDGRPWASFAERWQIVASVAGTEITYGLVNGWHPHKHVLIWSRLPRSEIRPAEIREEISRRFEQILAKRGRYANPVHGVDVRIGDDLIAEYIAKFGHEPIGATWSLAAELTKGNAKISLRADQHYTPFQLLDLFAAGDARAGVLFQEYAAAMFGTNQLVWSPRRRWIKDHWKPGARELLGLYAEPATDEEIAASIEQDAELFALLNADDWKIILKHNMRGHLLEVASLHSFAEFEIFLAALGITLPADAVIQ